MAKELFSPEKCPKCGRVTVVEDYDTGWRVEACRKSDKKTREILGHDRD